MTPVTSFAGRTVALFGLGGSGLVTAQALAAGGARVTCWDDSPAARDKATAKGLSVEDLGAADWARFAALVLTPGVPLTHPRPHWTVDLASGAGIEVIGDIELFCREREKMAPHAPFIAITGTNGKSTTTALTAHILRTAGKDVQLGGNIGTPILALEPPHRDRVHVIEVSSFQIDLAPSLRPTIGVLLNLTPDHLDRHGTMENYAAVKARLVEQASVAVIGMDDEWTAAIADRLTTPFGKAIPFSAGNPAARRPDRSYIADRTRILKKERPLFDLTWLADIEGIGSLRGRHNLQNAVAATAAVKELFGGLSRELHSAAISQAAAAAGGEDKHFRPLNDSSALIEWTAERPPEANVEPWLIRVDQIQLGMTTYPGLPHRMEEVGRAGKVLFVNDSKATNADAAEKALLSFETVFWIAGGKAKEGGIEPLRSLFGRIAKAYLIGAAAEDFARTLAPVVPCERCGTLELATARAAADAALSVASEPVVLLSPACASYDQFPNFEVRGDRFRELVRALPGVIPTGGTR